MVFLRFIQAENYLQRKQETRRPKINAFIEKQPEVLYDFHICLQQQQNNNSIKTVGKIQLTQLNTAKNKG